MTAALQACEVGFIIPPVQHPPISRTTLALYADASGDHNPIHIDIDLARAAGFDDVIAHGMLSAAYLGRLVTDWAGQDVLLSFAVRFVGVTAVHDVLTCAGVVTGRSFQDGKECLSVALTCMNQQGELKVKGEAMVVLGILSLQGTSHFVNDGPT